MKISFAKTISMPVLGCVLAAGLSTSCAKPSEGSEINGTLATGVVAGTKISAKDILAKQVALIRGSKTTVTHPSANLTKVSVDTSSCTGTFIDRQIILTAAHCLASKTFDSLTVTLETNTQNVYFKTTAKDFKLDNAYKGEGDLDNDLALIKTDLPLPENFPITLLATRSVGTDTTLLAAGFGATHYPSGPNQHAAHEEPVLRSVKLKTNTEICPKNQNAFCTKADLSAGVSSGDSGGPIFTTEDGVMKQLGVETNALFDNNNAVVGAAYVSVPLMSAWIEQAKASLLK